MEGVDAGAEAELRALGTRRRFPAGASVFLEGDVAHEALVILDVLGPGALVGELSAIDGHARSATATALTPIEVLSVPCTAFVALMHRRPELMYQLLVSVADRLRSSVQRQLEFGTGDALGRLCGRLVELADRYGRAGEGECIEVRSPVSQADLAAWTGISREAVVKALRHLRQLGWIENQGAEITICDLASLQARAAG